MSKSLKEKKPIYKEWWFWLIIFLAMIVIFCLYKLISLYNVNSVNDLAYQASERENYENSVELNENPFKIVDEYDGIYEFKLDSDNGTGNTFTSIGAILFDNGNCKIKYLTTSVEIDSEVTKEYNGFCGKDSQSNSDFTFLLNNDTSYECTKTDEGFSCQLTSEFDLSGCMNKALKLKKIEKEQDIDSAFEKIVKEEEKAKEERLEKDFKKSCKEVTYENLARNPQKMEGTNVKIMGEVIQVMNGDFVKAYRVNITKNEYDFYEDTIYLTYVPKTKDEDNILEDDIITIWGTASGDYTYTSVMGASVTVPHVDAEYIEIN